jgi:large subunit ribosomal protein L29
MKTAELRARTLQDLKSDLLELHREQFNLRMQKATGQLSKPHLIPRNRRQIARINTLITERERAS